MHSGFSSETFEAFKDMVLSHKSAFAYSAADLMGYSGDVGPFDLPFHDETAPCFERARPQSPLDGRIIEEKASELLDARIMEITPKYDGIHCSHLVVAAKKDADTVDWT